MAEQLLKGFGLQTGRERLVLIFALPGEKELKLSKMFPKARRNSKIAFLAV